MTMLSWIYWTSESFHPHSLPWRHQRE